MRKCSLVARLSDGIQVLDLQPLKVGYVARNAGSQELWDLLSVGELGQRLSLADERLDGQMRPVNATGDAHLNWTTRALRGQSVVELSEQLRQCDAQWQGDREQKAALERHLGELEIQIQQFQSDLQQVSVQGSEHSRLGNRLEQLMAEYRELQARKVVEEKAASGVSRCLSDSSLQNQVRQLVADWERVENRLDCSCRGQLNELKQLLSSWESQAGEVRQASEVHFRNQRFEELNREIARVRNRMAVNEQASVVQVNRRRALQMKLVQLESERNDVQGMIANLSTQGGHFTKKADQVFAQMTDGLYRSGRLDAASGKLAVTDNEGQVIDGELLSEAVWSQFLMSRLAGLSMAEADRWWIVATPQWKFLNGALDPEHLEGPRRILFIEQAGVGETATAESAHAVQVELDQEKAIDPLIQPLQWQEEEELVEEVEAESQPEEQMQWEEEVEVEEALYEQVEDEIEEECELEAETEEALEVCETEEELVEPGWSECLDMVPSSSRDLIEATGCTSVREFLQVSPETLLNRAQTGGEYDSLCPVDLVRLQRQIAFLSCVEGLDWEDTDLLLECGIYDIETFADLSPVTMQQMIRHHIANGRAPRHYHRAQRYTKQRLDDWNESAIEGRQRWRMLRNSGSQSYRQRETIRDEWSREDRDSRRSDRSNSERYSSRSEGRDSQREHSGGRHSSGRKKTNRKERRQRARERRETEQRSRPQSQHTEEHRESSVKQEQTRSLRFYLNKEDAIVDAPGIGPKSARMFEEAGVKTISDLLNQEMSLLAQKLKQPRFPESYLEALKQQCQLQCQIPEIRGHDAQILVGCEIDSPSALQRFSPEQLLKLVEPFVNTKEGERIVRGGKKPDLAEVTDWIEWSKSARGLSAA